jgi:hypothetical protein
MITLQLEVADSNSCYPVYGSPDKTRAANSGAGDCATDRQDYHIEQTNTSNIT